jgi:probable F420-dependent oxidoreductase
MSLRDESDIVRRRAVPRSDRLESAMQFGVVALSATTGTDWTKQARRYEASGFDYLFVPDHIGLLDPFAAVASVAATTERLRLGTLVLNMEFWNPLLLARAAVTTQLLAGGRFVLGLGAGHARAEFEQAGLRYPPPRERVRRLSAVARVLPPLAAGETIDDEELRLHQAAVGLPPTELPLLVGGNGDRVLHVAATYADIVSLVGFTSGTGQTHTNRSHWSWEGLRNRIDVVRQARQSGSLPEVHVLIQFASVTNDREAAVTRWHGGDVPKDYLDSPFMLVGDEGRLKEQLHRLAELNVNCVTVFDESAGAAARMIGA